MLSSKPAIESKQLTKRYGSLLALDHLSLTIPAGSLFGLLGPNGAGKTTFLRTLMGYIRATSGQATVFGVPVALDSRPVRSMISYLPAEAKLFRAMKGSSVLKLFSELHPNGNHALAISLGERLKLDTSRIVGYMSTGMRQKLAIACVLAIRAPLIVLDEPTANLDPTVRNEVLQIVREAHQGGSTIVFSSHLLDEVELLCDQAAIINHGRVQQIVDLHSTRATYEIVLSDASKIVPESLPNGIGLTQRNEDPIKLRIDTAGISLNEAIQFLVSHNISVEHVQPLGLRTVYEACSVS